MCRAATARCGGGHARCSIAPSAQEHDLRHPSTADSVPPPEPDHAPAERPDARRVPGEGDSRAETRPVVEGESAPREPHERDESADSGTGAPSDVVKRGHDDVVSGKTGTDKGEATDAVYRRTLRSDTPGAERD
jgi:hypothetical protein